MDDGERKLDIMVGDGSRTSESHAQGSEMISLGSRESEEVRKSGVIVFSPVQNNATEPSSLPDFLFQRWKDLGCFLRMQAEL